MRASGAATTSWAEDRAVIESDRIPHDHELVHAVHHRIWPPSRSFLHEGLAVLFGSSEEISSSAIPEPASEELDRLFETFRGRNVDYSLAWFVVSQIVREHGFDGLKAFWHEVPRDASAEEVRAAFERTFGEPVETLFEPEVFEIPGIGTVVEDRRACYFTVCVGDTKPWMGNTWSLDAPRECADETTLGPTRNGFAGEVWTQGVMEVDAGSYETSLHGDDVLAMVRPCHLRCTRQDASPHGSNVTGRHEDGVVNRYRVQVGHALDLDPVDAQGSVDIVRQP